MNTKSKLNIMINVLVFTSIIGLAMSYATTLIQPYFPKLNFLEAVGVYCLWTPIHHGLNSIFNGKDLEN
jgi:hypothetical protein